MDNRIALPALAVVGLLGVAGFGYGAYQAGLNQSAPARQAVAETDATDPPAGAGAPAVAQVTGVEPIIARWQEPRQVCEMVTVQRQAPVKDEARVAGTLLGAAIGGVVGHQFGGGRGKDAATVAGAIAGGYAGNRVQGQRQQGNTYTTTEQRCHTVMDNKSRTDGYLVSWQLGDRQGTLRMTERPGGTLPVRDGVVQAY